MDLRWIEVVRVSGRSGGGPGGGILVVGREIALDGAGCALALRPLMEARPGLGPWTSRLGPTGIRPFTLRVAGGKARFDRDLRLPGPWQGLGLGTWLLCSLVRLAVLLGHGEARPRALHLVGRDHTPLRAAFYRSMCFTLTLWPDGTGFARAARLADLRLCHDPAKVHELGAWAWARRPPLPDAPPEAPAA